MNATIGTTLKGRYQIIAHLKKRAFGKTYRAIRLTPPHTGHNPNLAPGGDCIIQTFQPPSSHPLIQEDAKRRFEQNLSILNNLGAHPQIPTIIDGFTENQELYLVRQYIPGQSLESEMNTPWSPNQVIAMLQEVLQILDFIHQCGTIHGNITPANLIRHSGDGKIFLTDFARIKEIETIVLSPLGVATTAAVGTPGYMPLEQLDGKPQPCSDIYALGITAIFALTGVEPRQLAREPKTGQVIWHYLAPVPDDLMAILDRMVSAHMTDRYQSAAAVARDLAGLGKINRVLADRYQIVDVLYLSPLGTTFKAVDLSHPGHPPYAIKEIPPLTSAAFAENSPPNFEQIAHIRSSLGNHPLIPHLVDDFPESDTDTSSDHTYLYLVQELVQGEPAFGTGSERIAPTPWTEAQAKQFLFEALQLLDQTTGLNCYCLSLEAYRYLKRRADGKIVLADLNFIPATAPVELSVGGYLPPKNAREGHIPHSEIYALGMLVIHGLTGIHPAMLRRDPNSDRILWREQAQDAIQTLEISHDLGAILDKMVRPYFRDRYQSAREVLADLSPTGEQGGRGEREQGGRGAGAKALTPIPSPRGGEGGLKPSPEAPSTRGGEGGIAPQPPSPPAPLSSAPRLPVSVSDRLLVPIAGICLVLAGVAAIVQGQKWQRYHTADNYIEQANSFLDKRLGNEAIGQCDWAISIASSYSEAWKCHGDALYILERYKAALVSYQKASTLAPKNPKYWNNQGETLYQMGNYSEAIAAHDRALTLDKRNAAARKGRGLALIGLNRYSDAIGEFDQAIALDPSDPKSWENKGLALEYLSNPTGAREAYQEALAVYGNKLTAQPKSPTMWVERGRVLSKLQRATEALASYDKALEISPQFYLAWNAKGSTLYSKGQFEAAVASYDKALEINPQFYTAWHNRGAVLNAGLGRYEEAISSYETVLKINPNFYHAWRDKGAALAAMSRYQEAIEAFDKALKIEPNDHKSWVSRGLALTELARDEEALASFDKAISIYPLDAFAWTRRGVVLEYLRRDNDALASYEKAVEIQPKFQSAIEARSRLRQQLRIDN